jgi:putative oxidoreductase
MARHDNLPSAGTRRQAAILALGRCESSAGAVSSTAIIGGNSGKHRLFLGRAARVNALYATLSPWVWLLLRATAGLVLLPHALQKLFAFFPESKVPSNLGELAASLEGWGYRPGWFWALVVAATELIAGPLLALGLFTRLAALPIFIFLGLSAAAHGKRDGYFWTIHGAEYPLVWAVVVLFFLVNGGGPLSLDQLWFGGGR